MKKSNFSWVLGLGLLVVIVCLVLCIMKINGNENVPMLAGYLGGVPKDVALIVVSGGIGAILIAVGLK